MTIPMPRGLSVNFFPEGATWGALREFVRMADEAGVPDEADLRCVTDINGDFDGIRLSSEDGSIE